MLNVAPNELKVVASYPPKLEPLLAPSRYKIIHGGRGGGKSWFVARFIVAMCAQKKLRVLCAREIQNSIKDSVKKLLEDQIISLGLSGFFDCQQSRILGANGSEILFEGLRHNTNRIKSYEGIDLWWVEEAAPVSNMSWRDLIPTARKKAPGGPFGQGTEIWITFNPVLETDETYQRFIVNTPADAIKVEINWRDNPYFPLTELRSDMEADRRRSEDLYLHVWEGHCLQSLEGAVYAEELREARSQNRIRSVPYDRSAPVNTYWDLGRSDHTSIWFAQQVGWDWRVIDFYQGNLKHLDHYLEVLQNRHYIYGLHWFPHDAAAKSLGTKMSIWEQAREKLGSSNVKEVPKLSIVDGINAARTIFPQCYFDEDRCADGLHALRHYQYDVVEVAPGHKVISTKPVHNWASDASDSFRYLAVASKLPHRKGARGDRARAGVLTEIINNVDYWLTGNQRDASGSTDGWLGG